MFRQTEDIHPPTTSLGPNEVGMAFSKDLLPFETCLTLLKVPIESR